MSICGLVLFFKQRFRTILDSAEGVKEGKEVLQHTGSGVIARSRSEGGPDAREGGPDAQEQFLRVQFSSVLCKNVEWHMIRYFRNK